MDETRRIRVMIVDDHDVVRTGLKVFVETFEDLEWVGEASSGEEAIRLCAHAKPDVVLMDLVMPGMGGIAATETMRANYPETKVVALSSFQDEKLVQGVLQAGALSYLLKDASIDELARAIRGAYANKPTLAPEAARTLIEATTRPPTPGHDLTTREREVLGLLVKGLSNRQIAEQMFISQSTVKNHITSLFSKLGVSTRAEAVVLAMQHDLIT